MVQFFVKLTTFFTILVLAACVPVGTTWYEDADGDGFGNELVSQTSPTQPPGYVNNKRDCDDTDFEINPNGLEIPLDDIDQDCNGTDLTDPPTIWYQDNDGDGFGNKASPRFAYDQPEGYIEDNSDCNDRDIGINPDAQEIASDGIDQDCSGMDLVGPVDHNLSIINSNKYPTRITQGADGKLYVTDAMTGSVFIYDAALKIIGELKELAAPLGIAVDPAGNIYVGNNGRDNVEVYDNKGFLSDVIDDGNITMPNDMALDNAGNLYVVDSKNNIVKAYDSSGQSITNGDIDATFGLLFPSAIAITYSNGAKEVYVADQGNSRIQGFGFTTGAPTLNRSFGAPIGTSRYAPWRGNFVRVQGLAFDTQGRLYACDSFLKKVQRFEFVGDNYIYEGYYGYESVGSEPEDLYENIELKVPLDAYILNNNHVIFADAGDKKLKITAAAVPE